MMRFVFFIFAMREFGDANDLNFLSNSIRSDTVWVWVAELRYRYSS